MIRTRSPKAATVALQLLLSALLFLVIIAKSPSAMSDCLNPPGDLTGDNKTDVVDTQCAILTALWSLVGSETEPPACLPANSDPVAVADQNCDTVVSVADAQLVILFALGTPLAASLDADNNQCPDACEVECVSKALLLDGKSCVVVPDVLTEGFDEYTIEFWVYPVSTEIRFVLDKVVDKNITVPGWRIRVGNLVGGVQKIHYEEIKSNGNFHGALSADNSVPTDKWTHYAITRDQAGQLKVYINGFSPGPLSVAAKLIPDQSNNTPLYIGCQDNTDGYFIGMIDELRISKTLRYTSSFTPKTTSWVTDSDTLLLMHFDGQGDGVADASGNGHDGTYLGNVSYGSGSIVTTECR
ncbi:MAG: LamG domain-containing protein [Myxococcales bacterium]|nr:LamG domain-containing protein [Myxococcales bacterium]